MPNKKRNNKQPRSKRSRKTGKRNTRRNYTYKTPVLKLRCHAQIVVDLQGKLVQQFNIVPSLESFPEAVAQAQFYQSYRITKVHVHFVPSNNVNSTAGTGYSNQLVTVFHCPLRNNKIPFALPADYLQYAACKVVTYDHHLKNSFSPLVPSLDFATTPQIQQQATYLKSPTLSCANLTSLHFGHTYLFVRRGQNVSQFYTITAIVSVDVEFYNYDGQLNQQVPFQTIRNCNQQLFKKTKQNQQKVLKPKPKLLLPPPVNVNTGSCQKDQDQYQYPQCDSDSQYYQIPQLLAQGPQQQKPSLLKGTHPFCKINQQRRAQQLKQIKQGTAFDPVMKKMLEKYVPDYKEKLKQIRAMIRQA